MKQGHINIHGTIGSIVDSKGQQIKGVELIDIISQVKAQPGATSFLVHIGSPGGLVDAGNQIFDYLESLKASGILIDTISDSYITPEGELKYGIGSIATKPFLAGINRTIVDGHEFFIHNPWTQPQPGDSNQIALELQALKQTEAELRAFYQQHTKVTDAGLKGLMDNETGMSADQAVALGFATKKLTSSKIKALAQINNNMATETISQKLDSIFSFMTGKQKAEVPALPGAAAAVPDPNTPADPNTLPDGEYPLADGRIIVITGGQITEVKMPAAAAQPAVPAAAVPPVLPQPSAAEKALQEKVAALELAAKKQEEEMANAAKALDEFKATLVSGKSPAKAFNNMGGSATPETTTNRSIAQVQAQKRDERKKQINRN